MIPAALEAPIVLALAVAAAAWLLSLVTREYSWVDRIWSIVPPIYVGLFAWRAGGSDVRLDVMTALTALWGARLTFNFARKGGYAPGGEDYRWAILKARMRPWQWHAFNALFIAGYQNLLLLLIALPAWTASEHPTPFGAVDAVLAALFLVLLGVETVADGQQWAFHGWKRAAREGRPVPDAWAASVCRGFLDRGLFAWSRHPNFFCEQAQWWVLYAFAVSASGEALHPTLIGPVLLTLLFHGSANFTEAISAGKYPEYKDYQRRVSRMLPLPPARRDA